MNAQTEMTDECREAFEVELRHLYPSAIKLRGDDGKYIGHMEVLWKFFQSIWNRRAHLTKVGQGQADHIRDATKMVVEPSVVPMPEPNHVVEKFSIETDEKLADFHYWSEELLTAYADARVSEETRELVDGLRKAITQAEIRICTHDETHRGGAIWEICDQCGAKWADDEGGKPEFKWPEAIVELNALIVKYTQTQKESK
jgi:hypothetical protein